MIETIQADRGYDAYIGVLEQRSRNHNQPNIHSGPCRPDLDDYADIYRSGEQDAPAPVPMRTGGLARKRTGTPPPPCYLCGERECDGYSAFCAECRWPKTIKRCSPCQDKYDRFGDRHFCDDCTVTYTITGKFSGRDNTRWSGRRTAQCPLCHELFSGESTFVLHRIEGASTSGQPGKHVLGECRDPSSKGMTLNDSGVWTQPVNAPGSTEIEV